MFYRVMTRKIFISDSSTADYIFYLTRLRKISLPVPTPEETPVCPNDVSPSIAALTSSAIAFSNGGVLDITKPYKVGKPA